MILYNLLSAYKRVCLLEEFHTARPKRLRFLLLNTVGKVVRHAARPCYAAPSRSPEPRRTAANLLCPQPPRLSRGFEESSDLLRQRKATPDYHA